MKIRKIFVAVFFLFLLPLLPLYSEVGLGFQLEAVPAIDDKGFSFAVTYRYLEFPFIFAVRGGLCDDDFLAGLGCDYWFCNPKISGSLHYYFGPGLLFNTCVKKDGSLEHLYGGTRLVLGLNSFIQESLEFCGEISAAGGVNFAGEQEKTEFSFRSSVSCGFRYWL